MEDGLFLNLQDAPQTFRAGENISELTSLWCPGQSHDETSRKTLVIRNTSDDIFLAEADGFLCACNFGDAPVTLPGALTVPAGRPFPVSWGASGVAPTDLKLDLRLNPCEPVMVEC